MAIKSKKTKSIPAPVAQAAGDHIDAHTSLEPRDDTVAQPKAKKELNVVATAKGVYNSIRYNEGDKFTIKSKMITGDKGQKEEYTAEEQFSKLWMKKI